MINAIMLFVSFSLGVLLGVIMLSVAAADTIEEREDECAQLRTAYMNAVEDKYSYKEAFDELSRSVAGLQKESNKDHSEESAL